MRKFALLASCLALASCNGTKQYEGEMKIDGQTVAVSIYDMPVGVGGQLGLREVGIRSTSNRLLYKASNWVRAYEDPNNWQFIEVCDPKCTTYYAEMPQNAEIARKISKIKPLFDRAIREVMRPENKVAL